MPLYEIVVIYRPDLPTTTVEAAVQASTELLQKNGAVVSKTEFWGLRTTAYPVNDHKKAYYAMLHVESDAAVLKEFERTLHLNEQVLRFLTTVVEEFEQGPSAILRENTRSEDELEDVADSIPDALNDTPKSRNEEAAA
jgi:small subunit ribosomal protein S6